MPTNVSTWPSYFKYLCQTYHPIAKSIITNFNQTVQTTPINAIKPADWKQDCIKQIRHQTRYILIQWSANVSPAQKTAWQRFVLKLCVHDSFRHRQFTHCLDDFISLYAPVQLDLNDYINYYQHHPVDVDDTPTIMNSRAEPLYHQLQMIETTFLQKL